jgi:NADH-quinone oxidoreductase subunit L
MLDVIWLIPLLPLAGFVFILLFGRRLGDPLAGWVATITCGSAFVVSAGVFFDLISKTAEERHHVVTVFSWLPVGSFKVDAAFLADPLSITMALFVTGIGTLIHLYAIGYMHGDPKFSKFFLYLNLFAFSMLMLVLGSNLLVTFLGWEGVGTCSYFLISFWHTRESAATAGKKAFVTNRVGDWGFMVAMFLAFQAVGSLDYSVINGAAGHGLAQSTATAIILMLFVGACGKSAQLPLYLWLPDAMEGPTPVSALIHAATMVTAGVFLMVRMSPVLNFSFGWAPDIIATVGAVTALFAATVAVAQNDIKKVLAYSTVSQLGFMFLAVGSGAYTAAIFHMVTHAFFKALLFLGSGSVIHGMHHEQDMRKMGALRKLMPITAGTFIIGWLAIAGIPPFAGFWSKDEILLSVWAHPDKPLYKILWVVGVVAALLTAFYMTRQVIMVFFGKARWEDKSAEHGAHGDFKPHESPVVMVFPLVILAALAFLGGGINLPFKDGTKKLFHWLEPAIGGDLEAHTSTATKIGLAAGIAVACALAMGLAYAIYQRQKLKAIEPQILADGWRYDRAVSWFMDRPGRQAFEAAAWADSTIVDGAVNGAATSVRTAGSVVRRTQTGFVRNYALLIGGGVVLMLGWFFLRALGVIG